ncbi:hypothetical protein Gotur_028940 [Gossypium turneri]
MEKGFLDKVEDNAAVRTWSEATQHKKGDSLIEGYWNDEVRQLFYSNYEDLPYLLDMKVDKRLFRALTQFWNTAYSCFTFGKVDIVPTVEEYMVLLRCSKIQVDRAYSRAKGDRKCIPRKNLKDIILAHPDMNKKVDVFALSIYDLIVFPKALGHVDEVKVDLSDVRSYYSHGSTVISGNYLPLKDIVATPRVMVAKRRFERYQMRGTRLVG